MKVAYYYHKHLEIIDFLWLPLTKQFLLPLSLSPPLSLRMHLYLYHYVGRNEVFIMQIFFHYFFTAISVHKQKRICAVSKGERAKAKELKMFCTLTVHLCKEHT